MDKLNLDGNYIESFDSIEEARINVGLKTRTPIVLAVQGKRNKAGGFKWKF